MGCLEDPHSLVKSAAEAKLAHDAPEVVSPSVRERLSVQDEFVQEVKLLLNRLSPIVVLLEAFLDELFHLVVV